MNKKKILILVMSCNQPHFINQEVVCRETWAKDILEGKYANIEYYSYTGGWKIGNVSKDQHHVFCSSGDGVYQTFQKTSECLSLLKENGVEYDYVFRTNTSTVINVGLLDAFINSGIDENTVYCGEIYSIDVPCPGSYFCYARGNSVIFSKKIIDLILDWSKYVVVPETMFADDNIIGDIINTYHILRFEPYKNYLKSYGFAWYKSLPKTPELAAYNALNNGVSAWNDDDDSYEHLKNFISIQIKAYNDRRLEEDRLRHISKVVCVNKDNYDDELKFINEYMKAPIMYYSDSKMRDYRKYYD
jgi:hypothetical protein